MIPDAAVAARLAVIRCIRHLGAWLHQLSVDNADVNQGNGNYSFGAASAWLVVSTGLA